MAQIKTPKAILVTIGIAVSAIVLIGLLSMTGAFNLSTTDRQANIEAMNRSLETKSPAMGSGLVWRRSFEQSIS